MSAKGKGRDRQERYVKLRYWLLNSQAWNSLSGNARALYVELAQRYNGSNNGRIPYSVREAANYAAQANGAHFWDNWEALLKTELGISRARRGAGGIALGRTLPSETDLHRRAEEYRCADVRLAQEESARARTARGARARYIITFEPACGVDGVRALRWVLKMAGRRFGLVAVDAYEDVSAPQEISNRAADEIPRASRRDCGGARGTLFAAP
jgi:hypothetical protein